jgi:signal transduction histidine kinase
VTGKNEVLGASGFLATEIADRRQMRVVLLIVLISIAAFLAGLPFLRMRLPEVPVFIPAFESAVSIIDVVTAALLFGQFMQVRSRSLLVLAAGYVFDAAMTVPHALTFPGSFSPSSPLQAGPQTAAGFPLFVLAYGLLTRFKTDRMVSELARAVVVACAGAIGLAMAFTLLATLGHDRLPAIIWDDAYTPGLLRGVGPTIWISALLALAVLWSRCNLTVLDLWLMAVLVAWLLEVAYSGRLGVHRYDFGWYAGRIYGLLARSLLLVMLLLEIHRLYARLTEALKRANRRNAELLRSREDFARVTGNLEIARREPNQPARRRDLLQSALQAADRGAETTQQLLAFVRRQAPRPEVLNANDAIKGVEKLIRRTAGEGVGVTMSLSPDLWAVRVDRSQFEAALLNIVVNARGAVEGAGKIMIETKNVSMPDGDIPDLTGGDFVMMSVSDNGPGIPSQIAAQAFDPFFTTKDVGKGSGLGLSQVYGFARGAGGHARIAAGSTAGATIEVYLPKCLEAPAGAAGIHDFSGEGAVNAELKLLLVEDDPDVRKSTADLLTTLGFEVVVAEGPHEALAILGRDPSIGLLFSDVAMPGGMNGAELAVEARRACPSLKVLLASGYPVPVLAKKFALPEDVRVLSKPFTPDDLMKELRRLTGKA